MLLVQIEKIDISFDGNIQDYEIFLNMTKDKNTDVNESNNHSDHITKIKIP